MRSIKSLKTWPGGKVIIYRLLLHSASIEGVGFEWPPFPHLVHTQEGTQYFPLSGSSDQSRGVFLLLSRTWMGMVKAQDTPKELK